MNLTDILTPELTNTIVTAVISVLVGLVAYALKQVPGFIKAKTTAEQFAFLQNVATVAVQAAEQLHLAGYIQDKKGVAIGIVVRELQAKGLKVDATSIDHAIEAAVMDAFNTEKVTDPASTVSADFLPSFTFGGVESPNQS